MLTDYLEALLELEQEMQEEQGLDWSARHLAAWAETAGMYRDACPGETRKNVLRTEAEPHVAVARAETETERKTRSGHWLTERLKQLHGSVERAKEQRARRASTASSGWNESTTLWMGTNPTPHSAADYAALVDAVFQRDARRYDGQLGLL